MKIRTKLFLNSFTQMALILSIGIAAFIGQRNIISLTDSSTVNYELVDEMAQKEKDHLNWVNSVLLSLSDRTLLRSSIETDHHKCGLGKWYYGKNRADAEKHIPSITGPLREMESPHETLHGSLVKMRAAVQREGYEEAYRVFNSETLPALKSVQSHIKDISTIAHKKSAEGAEAVKSTSSVIRLILIAVVALSVFVGIFLVLYIVRTIMGQLGAEPDDANRIFAKISAGDFTVEIPLSENDKSSLMYHLEGMRNGLEDLVSRIIISANNLTMAVKEISNGNQSLSQRTAEQASSLEEIASTIEETSAAISQNADNASNAVAMSMRSENTATEGGELVSDAVDSINEINRVSQKIGEITGVINEISFQTNLLALNAAIEAARAGEMGRGFAVVAGEVRNLAQKSGHAAREISDLINDSIEKITAGTDKANKSRDALSEIISSVKQVNGVISEIGAASREQKDAINQITTAVSDMDNMTQHNASLVEETASASEEMANQAAELLDMVSSFKIRNQN